jgi:hypothetical protein
MRGSVFWETNKKGCLEGVMNAQIVNIIGMIAAVLTALAAQADLFPDSVKGYITVGALIAGTVFAYLTKPGTVASRASDAAQPLPTPPLSGPATKV